MKELQNIQWPINVKLEYFDKYKYGLFKVISVPQLGVRELVPQNPLDLHLRDPTFEKYHYQSKLFDTPSYCEVAKSTFPKYILQMSTLHT